MLRRCFNPTATRYGYYGGRGITVCADWLTFKNFYDDMGEAPPDLSLDRINNNKWYSPRNCRWASRATQNGNRRRWKTKTKTKTKTARARVVVPAAAHYEEPPFP
jgi:hypothetical protein